MEFYSKLSKYSVVLMKFKKIIPAREVDKVLHPTNCSCCNVQDVLL